MQSVRIVSVIRAFADQATADIFNGVKSHRARRLCPATLWPIARRKLTQLNRVRDLHELAIPPGKDDLYEELFSSGVILDHVVTEPSQQGDTEESSVLVAALLIAVPDTRFGFGLTGDAASLSLSGCYRSIGTKSVDLREGSKARDLVTQVFNYLRQNAYWVDDDLVHMLALLTDLCQDRSRMKLTQVLSLSTSGNHGVDAGLFHAYQMVEALLEMRDRELLHDAIERWNNTYSFQLDADEIDFIRDLRDIALHFKAQRAVDRLTASRAALGFDQDRKREMEFCRNGTQKWLREATQAYVLARL